MAIRLFTPGDGWFLVPDGVQTVVAIAVTALAGLVAGEVNRA